MTTKKPLCWPCFLNAELAKLPVEREAEDKRDKCSRCGKKRAVFGWALVEWSPNASVAKTEQMGMF